MGAFKLLPTSVAAFWVNINMDSRLPLMHEGWSWGGENCAGIFQKNCVYCWWVLFISWIFSQLQSKPLRKEWGKHNKKPQKQRPLLHIDKRQSFAAHLKLIWCYKWWNSSVKWFRFWTKPTAEVSNVGKHRSVTATSPHLQNPWQVRTGEFYVGWDSEQVGFIPTSLFNVLLIPGPCQQTSFFTFQSTGWTPWSVVILKAAGQSGWNMLSTWKVLRFFLR